MNTNKDKQYTEWNGRDVKEELQAINAAVFKFLCSKLEKENTTVMFSSDELEAYYFKEMERDSRLDVPLGRDIKGTFHFYFMQYKNRTYQVPVQEGSSDTRHVTVMESYSYDEATDTYSVKFTPDMAVLIKSSTMEN